MNFTVLLNENNRAVSPVIGVILMVAITVILAAVIGSMVMGFSDSLGEPTPTASLEVTAEGSGTLGTVGTDSTEDVIMVHHNGGDKIELSDLKIRVSHATFDFTEVTADGTTVEYGDRLTLSLINPDEVHEEVNGGNITLKYDGSNERLSVGNSLEITVENNLEQDDGGGGAAAHVFNYSAEGTIWEIQLIHDPSDFILLEESVEVS